MCFLQTSAEGCTFELRKWKHLSPQEVRAIRCKSRQNQNLELDSTRNVSDWAKLYSVVQAGMAEQLQAVAQDDSRCNHKEL
jgi:hypothetical protein